MVGLKFGPFRFLMYYQTAFELAASVLQASKMAARYEGVHPSKWTEMAQAVQQVPHEPLALQYRRTEARPNFKQWKVGYDRNLVVFTFDNTKIRVHYSDAFEMYGWIRLGGRNAKRWAGDRGKQWTTRANLQDAEDNDKFVYAH